MLWDTNSALVGGGGLTVLRGAHAHVGAIKGITRTELLKVFASVKS